MRVPADKVTGAFSGKPSIYTATDPDDRGTWNLVVEGENVVCIGMHTSIHNLMLRNFSDWMPSKVSVGYGGDYTQATPPVVQAARVEPLFADTFVRKPILDIPVLQVADPVSNFTAKYTAMVAPDGLVTGAGDRPYINELGLMSENDTLLAHYITPLDGLLATQIVKTDLEWFVVEWEIEFIGA